MTVTSRTEGQPTWADLGAPDVERARTFYASVMGWEMTAGDPDFGGYGTAMNGDEVAAGFGPLMGDAPPAWLLYFSTDDAELTQARIAELGGTVIVPAHPVGDFGRLVVAIDPTGAAFGLWEAGEVTGFDATGKAGAWAWCDLRSPDPDLAREFYGALFGWAFEAVPMAGDEYTTFTPNGAAAPAGGVGPMMGADGVPAHWLNYFAVLDVDQAVDAVVSEGGTILTPAFDSPFGRMAPILDPAGAPLIVMQLPESRTT